MPDVKNLGQNRKNLSDSLRDKVGKIDLSQMSLKDNTLIKKASESIANHEGDYRENLKTYFQNHDDFKQYFPIDHGFLDYEFLDHTRGVVYTLKFKDGLFKIKAGTPISTKKIEVIHGKGYYSISTYMFIQSQANLVPPEVAKSRFDFLAITNLRLFLVDRFTDFLDSDTILGEDYEPDVDKLDSFLKDTFKHLTFLDFITEVEDNNIKLFISAKDSQKCIMETLLIEYDVYGDGMRSLVATLVNEKSGQITENLYKTAIVESIIRELLKCVKPTLLIQL